MTVSRRWLWWLLLVCPLSVASELRALQWEDLKPAAIAQTQQQVMQMQSSVFQLTRPERLALQAVQLELDANFKKCDGQPLNDAERATLTNPPSVKYPKAVTFWDKIKVASDRYAALQNEMEPELDGQRVKLPGYVLPLEFDGNAVTEFLLVPYVGACIHEPTPSANQMVYIKAVKPFVSAEMFVPVWVEGTLTVQTATYDLSLADGQAPVTAGYSMDAARVVPYAK